MKYLLVGGSVLLIITLIQAWLLTGIRILQIDALKKRFPSDDQLLKSHIDYILMALILFAFYAIGIELPMLIIVLSIVGATVNPGLFMVFAMKTKDDPPPGPLFKAIAFTSFVATTVGYGGAAIIIALTAV